MLHSEISTRRQLANYLSTTLDYLDLLIDYEYILYCKNGSGKIKSLSSVLKIAPDIRAKIPIVTQYQIPKRNKLFGFRTVHSCNEQELSDLLKTLNSKLTEIYSPIEAVQGFTKGRNIVSNASFHLNRKVVYSIDIKDFFESISNKTVIDELQKLGFKAHVCEWIFKIASINNKLVQGFSTSPTLANIALQTLDIKIQKIVGTTVNYTRYADDLYFSSESNTIELEKVIDAIKKDGLEINPLKTQIMRKGYKQFVTGLSVTDSKIPRIPKKIKRKARLELHYIEKHGLYDHVRHISGYTKQDAKNDEIDMIIRGDSKYKFLYLQGWLCFVHSIEPEFAKKLNRQLSEGIKKQLTAAR